MHVAQLHVTSGRFLRVFRETLSLLRSPLDFQPEMSSGRLGLLNQSRMILGSLPALTYFLPKTFYADKWHM